MEKVDRLGWAVGFSLETYGLRIGIRANDAAGLQRVCDHLPHEWKPTSSSVVDRIYSIIIGGKGTRSNVRRFNLLYGDHIRLARSSDVDQVFDTLESDLRLVVAEFARRRVFVHAGVVGWKGSAIVIPGRSYSGKSTLVAELVKAGATYYSDEYAVFDAKGRVHPFHKPLEIRNEGSFKQSRVTVEEIGGKSGAKPLPVSLVLMTEYKANARWRPRQLTPGQGVLALLSNTVSARRSPEKALASLQHVVAQAEILKGARGDASELSRAILERAETKKRARLED
jgi:hypothetical protein